MPLGTAVGKSLTNMEEHAVLAQVVGRSANMPNAARRANQKQEISTKDRIYSSFSKVNSTRNTKY